ncbi:hypothetical protein COJ27_29425 [Bacillus cereus]|nr:hypothetical protein COJ27_29425 [Bacillus cereus]PGC12669.1 hypothetical protein COM08_28085 [Bacillus wiedmannii]PGU94635.1 hypothetical protein COD71_08425 [Bacillus cereus]
MATFKGMILRNYLTVANRNAQTRKGAFLPKIEIPNTQQNFRMKQPRQEPLEHSWKKLNT